MVEDKLIFTLPQYRSFINLENRWEMELKRIYFVQRKFRYVKYKLK
jgi:hypothetical protein